MNDQDRMTATWTEERIREYIIGKNAERDRKILHRRLVDGIVFEKLAEEFGLSVTQVKRIVYKRTEEML